MFWHLTASANYLVPVIFGAGSLEQWAITHSLKDCCFWANLLIVSAIPPPLPLSNYLGALANNLGCFPLDTEAYPPMSHWLTKRLSIQSLPWFGTAFAARTKTVALPLRRNVKPLRLNAFRGDPASSGFDWNFTPNHNSSAVFSTTVGWYLHLVLPKLHTGHG